MALPFLFTSHIISSVYIKQVGNDVDEHRRTECASHVPAIKTFFKVKKKKKQLPMISGSCQSSWTKFI